MKNTYVPIFACSWHELNLIILTKINVCWLTNSILVWSSEILPPIFRGDTTFVVNIGEVSVYQFSVEDESSSSIVGVVGGIPSGANLTRHQETYQFSWILNSSFQNISLQFYASNLINDTTQYAVQVQLCNCQNRGKCTSNGLLRSNINTAVILNCTCSRGIGIESLRYYQFDSFCI